MPETAKPAPDQPDIFGIIADPARRALLQVLRDRLDAGETDVAVAEFVDATGSSRQTVNRHLGLLAAAGLVTVADDGPHRTYALDTTALEPVEDWLAQFVGLHSSPGSSVSSSVSTAFSAWAGAEAGETIGRTVAERAFRVREVVTKRVRRRR